MADLITDLDADRVRANLAEANERIAAAAARAGRRAEDVELVAAVKYVAAGDLGVLGEAGVRVVGENRAQDLLVKTDAHAGAFTWDFIGHLQSRKVKQIAPRVRAIHSLCTESAVEQLARHAPEGLRVLVQVDVAGEEAKSGVAPAALGAFLERCRDVETLDVCGLMTMPPLAAEAEDSRRWFAALRDQGAEHGLGALSMGTSQDFEVAVEEGATLVRIGTSLYR